MRAKQRRTAKDPAIINRPFGSLALPILNSLRILQIGMHERGSGGGLDRVFWDLVDQLAVFPDLALSPFFFQHRSTPIERRSGEFCLGSTSQFAGRRLWNLRQAVLSELRASRSGSVVVASHFAFYAAALLPKLSRMNHVVHFHGPWAAETAAEQRLQFNVAIKRAVEGAVYSSAKAFVTLSQAFKDLLTAEYRVDPARVHVIPGAVDAQRFSPGDRIAARQLLGWPQDARILFCIRRLVRRMGLENLLDAFAEVAGEHPHAMLVLGGTGALRDKLELRARNHHLSGQVRFTGFIPEMDLPLAYRAADLSILPSQSLEGFGLTALESLACGTPVLVTPVGGLPEVVKQLDTKLILPEKGAAAIADRLHLFFSGAISLPSSNDCRKYVESNFSGRVIAERMRALYWRVARG
jgi:glycosyltransferase involved in cell wall biosynthesis